MSKIRENIVNYLVILQQRLQPCQLYQNLLLKRLKFGNPLCYSRSGFFCDLGLMFSKGNAWNIQFHQTWSFLFQNIRNIFSLKVLGFLSLGMSFTKAFLPGEAVESRLCTKCCRAACVSCNRMKIPGSVICWRDFAELSVMFALQKGRVFLFHTSVHGLRGVITDHTMGFSREVPRTWWMQQAFSMEVARELALVLRSSRPCVVEFFFSTDTKVD